MSHNIDFNLQIGSQPSQPWLNLADCLTETYINEKLLYNEICYNSNNSKHIVSAFGRLAQSPGYSWQMDLLPWLKSLTTLSTFSNLVCNSGTLADWLK